MVSWLAAGKKNQHNAYKPSPLASRASKSAAASIKRSQQNLRKAPLSLPAQTWCKGKTPPGRALGPLTTLTHWLAAETTSEINVFVIPSGLTRMSSARRCRTVCSFLRSVTSLSPCRCSQTSKPLPQNHMDKGLRFMSATRPQIGQLISSANDMCKHALGGNSDV